MPVAAAAVQRRGLGDARRTRRLQQLVTALAETFAVSLPKALGGWAPLKGAYRFFANRAITPAGILAAVRPALQAQIAAAGTVLLIQDTTTITIRRPATRDLGPVGSGRTSGFLVHTVLAADAQGVPLGVAHQHLWTRDAAGPHRDSRRARPTAAKESCRWQELEAASLADLPAGVTAITVADREADLFALFATPRPAPAYLLVRAAQLERIVDDDGGRLQATVAAQRVRGHYQVAVPAAPGRAARTARCQVRWTSVSLQQPVNRPPGTPRQAPVPVTALLVTEQNPPAGVVPLHWLLLTTWPVAEFVAACQVLFWYTCRWLIERYHFVLKTGCRVEELQLQTAARLENAVTTLSVVAVRVLWLTYLAREQPETPCTVAFSAAEWQTLVCVSTQTPTPPATPPTLRAAAWMTARLGGFLGRSGDGEPGPSHIWTGLERLATYVAARTLFQSAPPVTRCG